MVQEYMSIPIDISGVKVNNVTVTSNDEFHIFVTSTIEGTHCHCCEHKINKFHCYSRELKLRHLSILGKPTYILIKPRRYICSSSTCYENPTTTQQMDWYDQHSSITKLYENHIIKQLINSTTYDVSQKEDIGYDTVEDVIDRKIGKFVNWDDFHELPTIGIDEVSIKKGHRDFATIVTVHYGQGNTKVIGVLKNRKKATVKEFLLSIPKHLRDTVQNVCTDLYEGYTESAREVFGGQTLITADRFHIARLYRKAVDNARKDETHRLKKELSKEEYKKFNGVVDSKSI